MQIPTKASTFVYCIYGPVGLVITLTLKTGKMCASGFDGMHWITIHKTFILIVKLLRRSKTPEQRSLLNCQKPYLGHQRGQYWLRILFTS